MITPWLAVHRLAVHRLAVHRLVVHRLVVHRLVVHPASFPWLDVPAPCCRHPFSRRQTRTENLSEAQISGHAATSGTSLAKRGVSSRPGGAFDRLWWWGQQLISE